MLSDIITAEDYFNELLPAGRLMHKPPREMLAAGIKWSELVWAVAEQLGPMPLNDKQINDGIKLAEHPVFVCGVHRSGTTLMKDILDGHPDLVVLPAEGTFYTNQEHKLLQMPPNQWAGFLGREWLRRLVNPNNQPPHWLLGRSNDNHSPYVNFSRYVMAWWKIVKQEAGTQWPHMAIVLAYASCTNNLSAQYWVDKTPTNERFAGRIRKEMPSAKIIHMLREPIATLTSRRQMEPSVTMRIALKFLRASFDIAAKRINEPGYLVLRYEDLCNEPEAATKQLIGFLEVDASATLYKPSVGGVLSQANSSFNEKPAAGVILKPGQHKPKVTLTQTEQQLTAAVMGKLANKLNYKLKHVPLITRLFLKLKYRIK